MNESDFILKMPDGTEKLNISPFRYENEDIMMISVDDDRHDAISIFLTMEEVMRLTSFLYTQLNEINYDPYTIPTEGDHVEASNGERRYVTKLNEDGKTFTDDGMISGQTPCSRCHLKFYKKVINDHEN